MAYGTKNYIYFTDKILGEGATCTVYLGRHKRTGVPCSVKIYNSAAQVDLSALNVFKQLRHANVVKFIDVESDSRTNRTVLIAELCSESLQKRLLRAEFLYGLDEIECIALLTQFAAGLRYLKSQGVTHRDIKPGHILCDTEYKISGFDRVRGAEQFQLVYTHPRMLLDNDDEYGPFAELWSAGVTMYQAMTGRLPFQTWIEDDHRSMYRLTSGKPSGAISSIQNSNGIVHSTCFPYTCALSPSFTDLVVPIIAKILEPDVQKQSSPETFFSECSALEALVLVYVFCVSSGTYFHIYLKPNDVYSHFKTAVGKNAKTSVENNTCFYFNNKPLADFVAPDTVIRWYPRTTLDFPILFLATEDQHDDALRELPNVPLPPAPADRDFTVDAEWAKTVLAYALRLQAEVVYLLRVQRNIVKARQALRMEFSSKLEDCKLQSTELDLSLRIAKFSASIAIKKGVNRSDNVEWQSFSIRLSQIEESLTGFSDWISRANEWWTSPGCELTRCGPKIDVVVNKVKAIHARLSKDQRLTYFEIQRHYFDKAELSQIISAAKANVVQHCIPHTVRSHECWGHIKEIKSKYLELNELEQNIQAFKTALREIMPNDEKNG